MSNLIIRLLDYSYIGWLETPSLRRFVHATKRAIGWSLIHAIIAMAVMIPFNETANAGTSVWYKPAPTGDGTDTASDTLATAWHNWAAKSSNWITYPNVSNIYWAGSGVAEPKVPRDNWALIGRASFMPATTGQDMQMQMLAGDKWITLGKENTGLLGGTNAQVTSRVEKQMNNATYVFAQYSPSNAIGRIVVQKIERTPNNSVNVYQADFTPWQGEQWKSAGKYRTSGEISYHLPGYNPFEIFKGAQTDPLFHNISWEAFKVAVGHAMRHHHAILAYVMQENPRMNQFQTSSSSLFSTTVTTTVQGFASPIWYVGMPVEAGWIGGETAQICANSTTGSTTTSCDDPAHVAIAGVMFSKWKGGNMPNQEDLMYQWVNSQSSWNVFFFALILAVVTWGIGYAFLPTLSALEVGVAVGVGYTLLSGGDLTAAQQEFFGQTGNGWVQPLIASSQQQQGLMTSIVNNMVMPVTGTGGMTGEDTLYKGSCPLGFAVSQCKSMGYDPGTTWRPDSYAQYNSTYAMRQRLKSCTKPITQGGMGYAVGSVQAEQCAAPVLAPMQPINTAPMGTQ